MIKEAITFSILDSTFSITSSRTNINYLKKLAKVTKLQHTSNQGEASLQRLQIIKSTCNKIEMYK